MKVSGEKRGFPALSGGCVLAELIDQSFGAEQVTATCLSEQKCDSKSRTKSLR